MNQQQQQVDTSAKRNPEPNMAWKVMTGCLLFLVAIYYICLTPVLYDHPADKPAPDSAESIGDHGKTVHWSSEQAFLGAGMSLSGSLAITASYYAYILRRRGGVINTLFFKASGVKWLIGSLVVDIIALAIFAGCYYLLCYR